MSKHTRGDWIAAICDVNLFLMGHDPAPRIYETKEQARQAFELRENLLRDAIAKATDLASAK